MAIFFGTLPRQKRSAARISRRGLQKDIGQNCMKGNWRVAGAIKTKKKKAKRKSPPDRIELSIFRLQFTNSRTP